ncbi:MAG: hypothetical protein ACO3BO_05915, partial [Anaerohalosphaeraceae bacterium]
PYPSCFIQPDGRIVEQVPEHTEGFMVNTLDLNKEFYDPSADFRDSAIAGKLTNARELSNDPCSTRRDEL